MFRISIRGAGGAARDMRGLQRRVQTELVREVRELGAQAVVTFQGYAPEDTGDTIDAIFAVPYFGRASRPRASIRMRPLAGHGGVPHDYRDVPRFGHRRRRITPKRGRALKVHIEGHRNAAIFVYRSAVRGVGWPSLDTSGVDVQASRAAYRPRDWVDLAAEQVERDSAPAASRLGRRIAARTLR